MTYNDVLDDLIDILKRHRMIQTWGYGNLSDLVTPFSRVDKTTLAQASAAAAEDRTVYNIDYPYAFLQPTNHLLSKGKSTFNFNLIVMEQCDDAPSAVIKAQSNCYQYIKDILAEIYYNYDQKFDFTLNSSVVPFKEKYDDTVSGMTAQISIEIPTILDDCIAPFAPKYDNLIMYVGQVAEQRVDEEDRGTDRYVNADQIFKQADWFTWVDEYADNIDHSKSQTVKIVVTGYAKVDPSDTSADVIASNLWFIQEQGTIDSHKRMTMTGWPTDPTRTTYQRFSAEVVTDIANTATEFRFGFYDYPARAYAMFMRDIEIKIYVQ